ncbi:MAG: phosphate signaling complex protein PhoU [Magnetococcales bacterium]|nr:phosphate signaling complex protein PhoU [Magnetococcales bacterium]
MKNFTAEKHIHHAFDQDLEQLDAMVLEMCDLVASLLQDAVTAVTTIDQSLARTVVERDRAIDELELKVEELAVRILALREPKGVDLRWVIAALESSSDLERMGDMAKNIAKRVAILTHYTPVEGIADILPMSRLILDFLAKLRLAWAEKDSELALQTWTGDAEIDSLFDGMFHNLMMVMIQSPQHITPGTHLLFVAKNLERIGDHITNVAEAIHYVETGHKLDGVRPRTDAHYRYHVPPAAPSDADAEVTEEDVEKTESSGGRSGKEG